MPYVSIFGSNSIPDGFWQRHFSGGTGVKYSRTFTIRAPTELKSEKEIPAILLLSHLFKFVILVIAEDILCAEFACLDIYLPSLKLGRRMCSVSDPPKLFRVQNHTRSLLTRMHRLRRISFTKMLAFLRLQTSQRTQTVLRSHSSGGTIPLLCKTLSSRCTYVHVLSVYYYPVLISAFREHD